MISWMSDKLKELEECKAENEKLRERNKELKKLFDQKVRRNIRGGLQQSKIEDLESKCDSMKTENEQLKAEVEHLNSIIKDEEDWKAIEQEYKDWSDR